MVGFSGKPRLVCIVNRPVIMRQDVGELVGPLVSVHRRVLLLPDVYGLLDPSVHSDACPVDDFGLIPDRGRLQSKPKRQH